MYFLEALCVSNFERKGIHYSRYITHPHLTCGRCKNTTFTSKKLIPICGKYGAIYKNGNKPLKEYYKYG
jgi:hypothetical protein